MADLATRIKRAADDIQDTSAATLGNDREYNAALNVLYDIAEEVR